MCKEQTMTFSTEAWQKNLPRYQTILTLPFNQELQVGTLAEVVLPAHHALPRPDDQLARALPDHG